MLKGGKLVLKRDYMGFVKSIYINDQYAAILSDGKCTLHNIDPQSPNKRDKLFPANENEKPNQAIGLTKHFLFLLDTQGKIRIMSLLDQTFIVEFKSDFQIQKLYPNLSGTRAVCINNTGQAFFFEASTETLTRINNFPQNSERIIWDQKDPNLFVCQENERNLITYLINKNNLFGEIVFPVPEIMTIEGSKDYYTLYNKSDC